MGKGSTTTQTPEIPEELKPLFEQTAGYWQQFQDYANQLGGEGGMNLFKEHPRGTVGPNWLEEYAGKIAPTLAEAGGFSNLASQHAARLGELGLPSKMALEESSRFTTSPYSGAIKASADYMPMIGRRQVTGKNIEGDPAIAAANEQFQTLMQPIIENQAALSGIGRSTALGNATAAQQAITTLPMVQDALAREERGLERELGAEESRAGILGGLESFRQSALGERVGALERGGQQEAGQISDLVSTYLGMEDMAQGRKKDALEASMGVGGVYHDYAQKTQDAQYEDHLRRAALWEQAMGAPFGLLPSSIGSRAVSSKK